jgi:hypothetical protein
MNEQQTKETKQPSGSKLYAIIVAAILTCAVVIGGFFAINAYDEQQRTHNVVMARLTYETLQLRKQTINTVAMMLRTDSPGYKLYLEWQRSTGGGTTEEEEARLAELEHKLKVMEPEMAKYFPKDDAQLRQDVSLATLKADRERSEEKARYSTR